MATFSQLRVSIDDRNGRLPSVGNTEYMGRCAHWHRPLNGTEQVALVRPDNRKHIFARCSVRYLSKKQVMDKDYLFTFIHVQGIDYVISRNTLIRLWKEYNNLNITRDAAIRLLTTHEVYNAMDLEGHVVNGKAPTMFDILEALGVSEEDLEVLSKTHLTKPKK